MFSFLSVFVIINVVLDMKIDKYVVIESDETYSFSSFEEFVKAFLGEDYYNLSNSDKKKRLRVKAYANMIGTDKKAKDYVFTDEKTFFYSLVINTSIVILERAGVNILIPSDINVKTSDNYIVVNNYVKNLLRRYGDSHEN